MRQTARVKRILPGGLAEVSVTRASACGHDCGDCAGCGAALETVTATARNPAGADAGDTVRLESLTSRILKVAAIVYLFPILLFFVFYFLPGQLGYPAAFGALGFLLGILAVIGYNKKTAAKAEIIYEITEIVEKR